MNIRDFCYARFGWLGRGLFKAMPGFEKDLDSAYMKIHPEVYCSIVGFIALVSVMVTFAVGGLNYVGLFPPLPFLPANMIFFMPFIAIVPLIVIVGGVFIPKTVASNRISGLKIEIPYASMYISTMTSRGLSPYESILRLRRMDLLPNMQNEVGRIDTIVKSQGLDPVTAMIMAAKVVDMNEYKELLLGYASTVRTGGDTLNYLFNQTDSMFRQLSTRIKALGENMGMLMEAYTIIGILGVLGLFLVFVVGMALPSMGVNLSPAQFFLFSFVILPMLSVVFIFLGDASQISYPISNWMTYKIFAAFLPIGLFLGSQMILPAFNDRFLFVPPIYNFLLYLRDTLSLAEGTEAALGLALTLIFITLPGVLFFRIKALRFPSRMRPNPQNENC